MVRRAPPAHALAAAHRLCLDHRERLAIGSHPARRLHHLVECLNRDAAQIGKDRIQACEGRPARRLGRVYLARTAFPFGIEFGTGAGAGPRPGEARAQYVERRLTGLIAACAQAGPEIGEVRVEPGPVGLVAPKARGQRRRFVIGRAELLDQR